MLQPWLPFARNRLISYDGFVRLGCTPAIGDEIAVATVYEVRLLQSDRGAPAGPPLQCPVLRVGTRPVRLDDRGAVLLRGENHGGVQQRRAFLSRPPIPATAWHVGFCQRPQFSLLRVFPIPCRFLVRSL